MAKQKFSQDQVIEALTKARGLVSIAARSLQCDQQTIRNYAARYPRVKQAMEDQRATLVDSAELRLVEAVEKKSEPWAVLFVLKTLGKERGYVERIEQTGKDGAAIEHSHTGLDMSGFSDDELRSIIARARGGSGEGASTA